MPQPLINAYLAPGISGIFNAPAANASFLSQFTSLHTSGRAALYWAFRGLQLPSGTTAWMPAYHCGVEVQAAIDAGLSVGFYRVRSDLSIDTGDLYRKVTATPGPVLLIHYFGFPQPEASEIAKLCRSKEWILIEDCAQALFSRNGERKLGAYGALAVYSLKKFLPIFDGGALQADTDLLRSMGYKFQQPRLANLAPEPYLALAKGQFRQLAGERVMSMLREIAGKSSPHLGELIPCSMSFARLHARPLSLLSTLIARQARAEEAVVGRRRNYGLLAEDLRRRSVSTSVFEALGPGTCPLVFPVRVRFRQKMLQRLASVNIQPFVFGAFPHSRLQDEELREAAALRDEIVGLPVHERLDENDLYRIGDAVSTAGPV